MANNLKDIDAPQVTRSVYEPAENALRTLDIGSVVDIVWDEVDLTYTSGNITGVVYKLNSTTVLTLALTYNIDDCLTNLTKTYP